MDDYPLLNLFWTMLWFFLFVGWIWLLISLISDVLRRSDLSGWLKAFWMLVLILLPLLGTLIYLVGNGRDVARRSMAEADRRDQLFQSYRQNAPAPAAPSAAEELTKLAQLRDAGTLTPGEFEAQKAKLLA